MIRSSKSDMINEHLSPVARNCIWREHVAKESTHAVLRSEFFLNPASLTTVADKPQQPYRARLTPREFADLSARSHHQYQEAKQLNNGILNTSRSRAAGSEIVSPRKQDHVRAYAQEVQHRHAAAAAAVVAAAGQAHLSQQATQATAADPADKVSLIHSLQSSLMTPRMKFGFPQTSSQEIGWITEPLAKADQSERDLFKNASALTAFADTYYKHHHHSPFSGASTHSVSEPHFASGTARTRRPR